MIDNHTINETQTISDGLFFRMHTLGLTFLRKRCHFNHISQTVAIFPSRLSAWLHVHMRMRAVIEYHTIYHAYNYSYSATVYRSISDLVCQQNLSL